jgi:hypothetical protein
MQVSVRLTDTSRLRSRNCVCGISPRGTHGIAHENWDFPIQGSSNYSWRLVSSVRLPAERIYVSRWSSSTDEISEWLRSQHTVYELCLHKSWCTGEQVLRSRACSASTTGTPWNYVIIHTWSLTQFIFGVWAGIAWDIELGPHLLPKGLKFQRSYVLVSVLLWLLEDVTVTVSCHQNSRFKTEVRIFCTWFIYLHLSTFRFAETLRGVFGMKIPCPLNYILNRAHCIFTNNNVVSRRPETALVCCFATFE